MKTLTALYSCESCGLLEQPCEVPARVEGQDVVEWFKAATLAVVQHHELASPNCHPKTLTTVKIPVGEDNERLGFAK